MLQGDQEVRRPPLIEQVIQDLRHSFRFLRSKPAVAASALLALALGIGTNTALFSAIYAVLLRPLPYTAGDRLVELHQYSPRISDGDALFSVPDVIDYRERTRSYEQLEEYHHFPYIILSPFADRVRAGVVSSGFFKLLGISPALGRDFESKDDEIGAPPVMILTNEYWRTAFAADPEVVGKTIKMNERLYTVVGVLPIFEQYPEQNAVYIPTAASPQRSSVAWRATRSRRLIRLFGRLKPGVSVEAADGEMASILAGLHKEYPADYKNEGTITVAVKSLHSQAGVGARSMLIMLLGSTVLVLLICCSSVANLLLARMVRREQEFALRTALGATRGRLTRQVLTESAVLALLGGLLGLLLARASMAALISYLARFTTRAVEIRIDLPVLLFTFGISMLTALFFGLFPALLAGRGEKALRITAGSSASRSRHLFRAVLTSTEVAICFVLLSAACLMARTLINLNNVRAGFDADHVATMQLPYNYAEYGEANDPASNRLRAYQAEILTRVQQLPDVKAAAMVSMVPLQQQSPYRAAFAIQDSAANPAIPTEANVVHVSPAAFSALAIPLLEGRLFTDADDKEHPAAIITQSMARRFFGNASPLGRRLQGDGSQMGLSEQWMPIVGIVADVHIFGIDKAAPDTIYVPLSMEPRNGFLFVMRSSSDPLLAAAEARKVIQAINPEQPVAGVRTLLEVQSESMLNTRVTATLLGLFAALAFIIVIIGLAGLMSYVVGQRTQEIGIRVALGAAPRQVLLLILSYSIKLIAIGTLVGFFASLATHRLLQNLLFGVRPSDSFTMVAVAVVLCGVALVASYIPVRRAIHLNPLLALRAE